MYQFQKYVILNSNKTATDAQIRAGVVLEICNFKQ